MKFSVLADAYEKIEATAGRLEMTGILSELFKKMNSPAEAEKIAYLLQGVVAPPHRGIELGMGEKFVMQAIALASGYAREAVEKEYKKEGDLGLVAQKLLEKRKQQSLHSEELAVDKVFASFMKIATSGGQGSQEQKIKMLAELLNSASPLEAKFITRFPMGRMRLGIGDPTILDAFSTYSAGDKSLREPLERAYNLCSDLGLVSKTFMDGGIRAIQKFEMQVFSPVRPALAERLNSPEEIMEKLKDCVVEAKYDGFRMQVHKKADRVMIFSRRQEEMTRMFPEVVSAVQKLSAKEIVFEGEALSIDKKTGKFLSFQQTIQRKRKYEVKEMSEEFPLRIFAFDLLFLNGEDLTGEKYLDRRKKLEKAISGSELIQMSESIRTKDAKELEKFFNFCINKGLEGIIAKDLNSPYVAGARKFAWIKLKRSYGAMVDTVDLVIVGYYLGKGQRADFEFGGLLAAVIDDEDGRFKTIARIGSGFTEEEMKDLEKKLDAIKTKQKPKKLDSEVEPDFWVEPKYVITASSDEITLSPMHTAGKRGSDKGYALRFPRMTAIRDDKGPDDATTVSEIIHMYELQKKKMTAR
ncbi:DNA ligase [Candidatus Gugararchaeum adminiculabundum]|nr:DNA ligase [Candidatus Gugararchaeum adminiculabundum]